MKTFPRLRAVPDIHRQGCDCASCEPYAPSLPGFARAGQQTCAGLVLGMIAGTVLVLAVNGVGPTLRPLLGL